MERLVRNTVREAASTVQGRFDDPVLARLWVANQIHRAADSLVDELLVEARRKRRSTAGADQGIGTWEELGAVLGISAQGARQRAVRRRGLSNRNEIGR